MPEQSVPQPSRHRSTPHRARTSVVVAAIGVLLAGLVAACGGSSSNSPDVPTISPETAVSAPPTGSARPDGTVVGAPASTGLALDDAGRRLVVLDANRSALIVYSIATPTAPARTRTIALPTSVVAIGAVSGDTVAAVATDSLITADLSTGAVDAHQIPVSQPLSVARLSSGSILVGSASGQIVEVGTNLAVVRTISGLVRVDELAVAPRPGRDDQVVALDRAQSSVTSVDMSDGSLGEALRAGDGATNLAVDHFGRFLTTDTRDGEFLGFDGDPLVTKFRYPVPDGPYAVGYDDVRDLAWVATTGDNQAYAFDLSTGIPVQKRRLATVGQADSMAVDSRTGTVYLLSARGEGLQAVN